MTSAQRVRNVLFEHDGKYLIEDLADGGAAIRLIGSDDRQPIRGRVRGRSPFPIGGELDHCADILCDAGFVVALRRGDTGVYIDAR
ncbi:MAG: hypothetical protein IT305_29505 [Chloroflexi bacterium]|nr:hypothetical protein [Chloroflexota bacterium]